MRSHVYFMCAILITISKLGATTGNSIVDFFPSVNGNLSKVTWKHAVNSRQLLDEALESDTMMLEADIILGTLNTTNDDTQIPVMGHPPDTESDLSLQQFITSVLEFNANSSNTVKKGIKLDFKTIEVFEKSVSFINETYEDITFPIWINADILPGPINSDVLPVNATSFLQDSKAFDKSVLSLGWTTNYGPSLSNGSYSNDQIENMLTTIEENEIDQPITYAVRAGLAAQSHDEMLSLLKRNDSTLTIWSSEGDPVNVESLRALIFDAGLDKVYIDVPSDLYSQLRLGSNASRVWRGGIILLITITTVIMSWLI